MPAQEPSPRRDGPWRVGVAVGPSFFWGAEGNTTGLELAASIMRHLPRTPWSIRSDVMAHHYGALPVYPCLLSVNGTCFSSTERLIVGLGVSAQYTLSIGPPQRESAKPYVLAGLATYFSTRAATRPRDCYSATLCPDGLLRYDFQNTDVGVQVGMGQTWTLGRREFYVESVLQQPLFQHHPGDPLSSFRYAPISFGMRW